MYRFLILYKSFSLIPLCIYLETQTHNQTQAIFISHVFLAFSINHCGVTETTKILESCTTKPILERFVMEFL